MPTYESDLISKIALLLNGDFPSARIQQPKLNELEQEIFIRALASNKYSKDLFFEDVAGIAPKLIELILKVEHSDSHNFMRIVGYVSYDDNEFSIDLNPDFVHVLKRL